jgi:cell division protein FtsX
MGGALGFAATALLYQLISKRVVASFGEALFKVVPLQQIALPMFVAYMALSVLVGVFGAANAIRDYLKV